MKGGKKNQSDEEEGLVARYHPLPGRGLRRDEMRRRWGKTGREIPVPELGGGDLAAVAVEVGALVEVEGVTEWIVPEVAGLPARLRHARDEAAALLLDLRDLLRLGSDPRRGRPDERRRLALLRRLISFSPDAAPAAAAAAEAAGEALPQSRSPPRGSLISMIVRHESFSPLLLPWIS